MTGNAAVAVLTTLYIKDRLDLFDIAITSIEEQTIDREVRIYLCCDGPLTPEQNIYVAANATRFHRIVRSQKNEGLAKALNHLIEVLEDEAFVFRMDGDDISEPERFKSQVELMTEDPELGLIGCQAWDIDEEGSRIGVRNYPIDKTNIARSVVGVNPILHPTFCFRREIFRDDRIRYPEAYMSEDLAMVVTLLENGYRIGNHPDRLFSWRITPAFFARRQSWRRGWTEMKWYLRAARSQNEIYSMRIALPIARLALRAMPAWAVESLYRSGLRDKIVRSK